MPATSFTYQEQAGLRSTPGRGARFLFVGVASAATANTVIDVPRGANVPTLLGQGPGAEALALANTAPGQHGPHFLVSPTAGVPGAWGAITKVGGHAGPTITTTASVPYDRYQWVWETLGTGDLGVGTGRYSLDGGKTFSSTITIPAGGTYLMPNTNTTLTFPAGAYTAGQSYTGESTAPYFSTANLATAISAAIADPTKKFKAVFLCGMPADGAAGAAMYTALSTQLTALAAVGRYCGGALDLGVDAAADIVTEMDGLYDDRILPIFGTVRQTSSKPFVGFARPYMPTSVAVFARACEAVLSESLGRVKRGPLLGVTEIVYDERLTGTLSDAQICATKTWPNKRGFYLDYDHIRGVPGSDFRMWPMRRIADEAATIIDEIGTNAILDNYATTDAGTLDPVSAKALEDEANSALRSVLFQSAASGIVRHVSDIFCRIDIESPYATDKTLRYTTLIRDSTRAEHVLHTLSFTEGSVTGESNEEPEEEAAE